MENAAASVVVEAVVLIKRGNKYAFFNRCGEDSQLCPLSLQMDRLGDINKLDSIVRQLVDSVSLIIDPTRWIWYSGRWHIYRGIVVLVIDLLTCKLKRRVQEMSVLEHPAMKTAISNSDTVDSSLDSSVESLW